MKKRLNLVICLALVLFVGLGILMSGDGFFSSVQEALRTKSVPAEMLSYGAFGKISPKAEKYHLRIYPYNF